MTRPADNPSPSEQNQPRVAIVVSRYNASVTTPMLDGALQAYAQRTPDAVSNVTIVDAPGAFELPVLASEAAQSDRFDAVLCLGCIIKGDTDHDRYIASAIANSLADLSVRVRKPVTFGVLTTNTPEQARERAGGRVGNKGAEAMEALLDTHNQLRALRAGQSAATNRHVTDKAARKGGTPA